MSDKSVMASPGVEGIRIAYFPGEANDAKGDAKSDVVGGIWLIVRAKERAVREQAEKLVSSGPFQAVVLALILINAALLGVETLPAVRAAAGAKIALIDRIIIYAFSVELALRIFAYRVNYFRNGWNIFDFVIVFASLFAASSGLAAVRAFRVLRVLRVVTVIPRMRVVVSALLDAIPGIASVGVVVVLIVYVFAVIGANLYGDAHPAIFGDVFTSMYTLFQVMTLEGWAEIANQVAQTHPRSWFYFLTFVLIATFTMLNLFVAIVVKTVDDEEDPKYETLKAQSDRILAELAALRSEKDETGR
jgi:voltage-gated sodium channel